MTRYSAAVQIPQKPRYQLGDQIAWQFVSDDTLDPERYGQTFQEEGTVLGLKWNPNIEKWIYSVFLTYSESSPGCVNRYYEELFEEEISHA